MANNLAINPNGPITNRMQPPPGFTFGPNGELIPIPGTNAPQPLRAGTNEGFFGPIPSPTQPTTAGTGIDLTLPPGFSFGPTGEIIPVTDPRTQLTNAPQIPGLIPPPDVNQLTGGQPLVTVPPTGPVTPADPTTGLVAQKGPITIDGTTGDVLPQAPPTGLIGAEQALREGATGGIDAILEGFDVSRQDIQEGRTGALSALDRAKASVSRGTQQGRGDILSGAATSGGIIQKGVTEGITRLETGGRQAIGAVTGAGGTAQNLINRGIDALEEGKAEGLDFLNQTIQQAVDPVTGFIDPGQRAQILQAALTGALGPDAQLAAIENFATDPGTKFAAQEAERALIRNASATGGLGGGRVRKALVRQAVGEAQKNFNTRIDQLGKQAALGLEAATTVGGFRQQQAITGAGLIRQTAASVAGLRETGAGITERIGIAEADIFRGTTRDIARQIETGAISQADIVQNASTAISNLAQQGGFAEADVESKAADIETATGVNLAAVAEATGVNISNILTNLGSKFADVRSQAGRDIADAIGVASSQLADFQAEQGIGVSDIVGIQIGNIANILLDSGLLDAEADQQLAILLGNLAIGQGTDAATIAQNIGNIESAGITGTNEDVQDAIKALIDLLGKKAGKEGE